MAKPGNQQKRRLREHMFQLYDADVLEPNGGRRGGIPFYRWYWNNSAVNLLTPNEVMEIARLRTVAEALDLMQKEQWTAGVTDSIFFLPLHHTMAFLETKTPNDSPSPVQLLFIEIAKRRGYIAGIVGQNVEEDADRLIADWQIERHNSQRG